MSDSTALTLRAALADYTRLRLRGARDNSRLKFTYSLDQFRDFLGREPTIGDLNDDLVTDWLWAMRERLAVPTCNSYGAKIKALWTFLARRGVVRWYPEFGLLPADEQIPVAWSVAELRKLFHAIDNLPGDVGPIPARLWWRSLALALWDSGERISAMLSARYGDMHDRFLFIRAEHRKGKAGHRKAACHLFHAETAAAIEAIRLPERTLIWEWPLNPGMLWYHWKKILRAAELPVDRYHAFHCFRRSTASYAEAGGLDASAVLGHADARTKAHYLSPLIVRRTAASDVLFRPDRGPENIGN